MNLNSFLKREWKEGENTKTGRFYFLSHFHYFISVTGIRCLYQKGDWQKLNVCECVCTHTKEGVREGSYNNLFRKSTWIKYILTQWTTAQNT